MLKLQLLIRAEEVVLAGLGVPADAPRSACFWVTAEDREQQANADYKQSNLIPQVAQTVHHVSLLHKLWVSPGFW